MKFKPILYLSSLYGRFILRVLVPPLTILLALCLIGLYLLNNVLQTQAVNNLRRSATTTASTLERELKLRETVLKQTGSELYLIKNEYKQGRAKLEKNRTACRTYIQQTGTYFGSPKGACDQFQGGLVGDVNLITSFDRTYRELGEALIKNHDQRINERLTAYKQFFPETMALLILNDNKSVVSSAYSGNFNKVESIFKADGKAALKNPVFGKMMTVSGVEIAVFAFQIPGGSVLAAYDVSNDHFLKQAWNNAPVDKSQTLVTILDTDGKPVYPKFKNTNSFSEQNISDLRANRDIKMNLDAIEHTAVASPLGPTNSWQVAVASPTAIVLAPVRDALIVTILIMAFLMVIFLWVGTFFIRHASRSIVDLVNGAKRFGEGHLQHKIKLSKHSESELLQLAETMNSMARHIAATEKSINEKNKEFISIATHELRAPLTAIVGNLTLFRETHKAKLNEKDAQKIDQAYSATVRLRDLVNDMLDVAHLESKAHSHPLGPVNIKSAIHDVLNAMAIVSHDTKIAIEYNEKNARSVVGNKQSLHIVMNNFVSNALKYSRPHDKVTISHRVEGAHLITTVEDTGLGIPEDQQAHIFQKFFRVNLEDRSNVTGTGLGMYIVKQYIEQMKGKVWFTSTYGKGTQFSFSLPIADSKTDTHVMTAHDKKPAKKS